MNKQRYSYCFLRYHHDLIGGEFANIGVLLWAPNSNFLGFRCSQRYGRLSQFFTEFEPDDYRGLVSRLQTQFDGLSEEYKNLPDFPALLEDPKSAKELAIKIIPDDDGAIQWSRSKGGLCKNPKLELDSIFETYIASHNKVAISSRRNDKCVYDAVYKPVFEQQVVRSVIKPCFVKSRLAEHFFQNSWKNGSLNVFETLSFDYSDSDRLEGKAYKWDSQIRHLAKAEQSPNIHLLLGSPRDEHKKAYGKAKDILASSKSDTRVILVEEDEVEGFENDLVSKVTSHLEAHGIL